jgi:hypothetical protein
VPLAGLLEHGPLARVVSCPVGSVQNTSKHSFVLVDVLVKLYDPVHKPDETYRQTAPVVLPTGAVALQPGSW